MAPNINIFGSIGDLWGNLVSSSAFPILLLSISVVIVVVASFLLLRRHMRNERALPEALQKIVLLVTVPKESEMAIREGQPQHELQSMLAEAEAWFATLGGMRAQRGMTSSIAGRTDHFALEMVVSGGLISFYVVTPRYLRDYLEQQIHAQYPRAQIEPVDDFNVFTPTSTVVGTTLRFKKPFFFPIRTYRQLEVDPLQSITNVLAKIPTGESAVIQYVVRSAKGEWHDQGARVARNIHQGMSLHDAVGKHGFAAFMSAVYHTFVPKKEKQDPYQQPRMPSSRDQEIAKSIEEKTSKAGMDVNIRIIIAAQTAQRAQAYLTGIVDAFSQYNMYEYGNGFMRKDPFKKDTLIHDYIYRRFNEKQSSLLNAEEMASVFHFPIPMTETPNIRWLQSRKAPAPLNIPNEGIVLGHSPYRGNDQLIRISRADRRRHVYTIGKSGVGKSVLLSNMIIQDIQNGEGVGVVDPHGDLISTVMEHIPKERADDVIYFNPSDMSRPVGLNMLEATTPEEKDFAVQEMVAIFYKLFPPEMIGPMFEHNMRNVMLTLMEDTESPGTIAEIPRMFTDTAFQKYKVAKVKDPVVRAFWEKEMAKTSDFHKSEMLGYLISKVGRFVENAMMRNIIGQPRSGFNFDDVLNNRKILLVNLAKGTTGEVNSNLLGLIIVSKLQMAAMKRVSLPEDKRNDFYLYLDEFQNFVTDSIATILSEARKYRLCLTMAHQYTSQLVRENNDSRIRDAVFGNAGTMIMFRVGVEDAETFAKEFDPVFNEYDIINVDMYTALVKLLINNTASKPFTMQTYPPQPGNSALAQQIIELSRMKYGRDQASVEQEIMTRSQLGGAATRPAVTPMAERSL
ncbi:MAG: type IV secretory system conjugative DNA transfer family protein [Candidatus Kerfeldbacteria bacterium]|nr:type IV secretory system conjugative DNA transfer family protein [Candidatus Kerfeldbacteria bacterium]